MKKPQTWQYEPALRADPEQYGAPRRQKQERTGGGLFVLSRTHRTGGVPRLSAVMSMTGRIGGEQEARSVDHSQEARRNFKGTGGIRVQAVQGGGACTNSDGHKGETHPAYPGYWIASQNIWAVLRRGDNRYWNAFGEGEPHPSKSNSIICEINFPYEGVKADIAGALARDESGRVFVLH
jgi:hypothetical protein